MGDLIDFMQENHHIHRVIIVGAGITGLSAAWGLVKMAQQPIQVTVLEENDRVGGKISSEYVSEGAKRIVIEGAADSFLTQKPHAKELIEELGISDQLAPIERLAHPTYTIINGKLMEMPKELMMMVPMNWKTFLRTPIFTTAGKARFMAELVLPKRTLPGDESLGGFVHRRFGPEVVDRIAEPLLSGIYNSDPYKQSINATFPQYTKLEREHGSVIKGTLLGRQQAPKQTSTPQPPFLTMRDGMASLSETLKRHLREHIRTQSKVTHIARTEHEYIVELENGEQIPADSIIITTQAYVAANLLKDVAPLVRSDLHGIEYLSTGTMALAYRADEVSLPMAGYGVVIPRSEKRELNALTIVNRKFAYRAPKDIVLIRAFFGGAKNPKAVDFDDARLIKMAQSELQSILGIQATPQFIRIQRMRQASPQYHVGHLDRVERIEKELLPSLYVAGSAYRGIGIPDCIKQGKETAMRILQHLPADESQKTKTSR